MAGQCIRSVNDVGRGWRWVFMSAFLSCIACMDGEDIYFQKASYRFTSRTDWNGRRLPLIWSPV